MNMFTLEDPAVGGNEVSRDDSNAVAHHDLGTWRNQIQLPSRRTVAVGATLLRKFSTARRD